MRRFAAPIPLAIVIGVVLVAQASRGAIRGNVVDSEGMGLPGATVTVSSPALAREIAVTGRDGSFKIDALPTGAYAVEAALGGLKPTKHENIRVLLGATTTITMRLAPAGQGATAPVIDPTDSGTGDRVTYEDLIKVPTARDPWAVLALVPGFQSDRRAADTGREAMFVGQGASGANAVWAIDGISVTDPAAIGSPTRYYDFGAIEDVQVTMAEYHVPKTGPGGVAIDIVTRRGSNELRGSGRIFVNETPFTTGPPLNGSTVSRARVATGRQGLGATTDGRAITVPAAQSATGDAADWDWPITAFLTSLGRSSGEAIQLTILNASPRPLTFRADGIVVEPVADVTEAAVAREIAQRPNAGRVTTTLNAYCLDFGELPPDRGMALRLVRGASQAPLRQILRASRRLQAAGSLVADVGDAQTYFDAIRQWAIWTSREGFDQRRFTDAFVQHARKNVEASRQRWDNDLEKAFGQLAPGRWRAIQLVLQEAARGK